MTSTSRVIGNLHKHTSQIPFLAELVGRRNERLEAASETGNSMRRAENSLSLESPPQPRLALSVLEIDYCDDGLTLKNCVEASGPVIHRERIGRFSCPQRLNHNVTRSVDD